MKIVCEVNHQKVMLTKTLESTVCKLCEQKVNFNEYLTWTKVMGGRICPNCHDDNCNHPILQHYHSLKDKVIGRFYCMQCEQIIGPENNETLEA